VVGSHWARSLGDAFASVVVLAFFVCEKKMVGRMKKVLFPVMVLILVVCLAPVMVAPAAATWTGNLLVNSDAEAGMTAWTYSGKVGAVPSQAESTGLVLPNSGDYFFNMAMGPSQGPEWMEQTIDLSGLAGTPVTFEAGGWVQTEWWWSGWPGGSDPGDYDRGALFVEFFDNGGGSLGVFTLSPVEHSVVGGNEYAEFSLTGGVPGGAASAVYRLEGYLIQGSWVNVFYDDLFFTVDVQVQVEIDIKPGSDPNSINLKSKGVVPVAVLTTDGFDASTVDPDTVEFAGATPVRWTMADVDGDGDMDLLFHFKTQDLNLTQDSTEATLTGTTYGGDPIEATDTVNIVPKGKG